MIFLAKPGLTATALFKAIEEGSVKAVWVVATNPAASIPDTNQVIRALKKPNWWWCKMPSIRTPPITPMSSARRHLAGKRRHDDQLRASHRQGSQALDPPGEAKADWRIIADLATRLGHGNAFAYADEARFSPNMPPSPRAATATFPA